MTDSECWSRYYTVTVDRPAWPTIRVAIERFAAEDGDTDSQDRFAVDLGCGAGRDARKLLRAGWRVLAIDREPAAIEALEAATPDDLQPRLETLVADRAYVSKANRITSIGSSWSRGASGRARRSSRRGAPRYSAVDRLR